MKRLVLALMLMTGCSDTQHERHVKWVACLERCRETTKYMNDLCDERQPCMHAILMASTRCEIRCDEGLVPHE